MANIALLGSPKYAGSSKTYNIDTMCEEGLAVSLASDGKVAAGSAAPIGVSAGRKGKNITVYETANEIKVQLAAAIVSITIGATAYIDTDGKFTTDNTKVASKAIFVSSVIGTNGQAQNIKGSESNAKKYAIVTFDGGL